MPTITIKFFPFAPGIPYKLRHRKIIIPTVNGEILSQIFANKQSVVVAHGGLIESFFSFSIIEALHLIHPTKQFYWLGDNRFHELLNRNNLAKPSKVVFSKEFAESYPVPIFLDKLNCSYMNCLNNYLNIKTFDQVHVRRSKDPILKQIFDNSLMPWDLRYIPKIRKQELSHEVNEWSKINKFYFNKPFVLINTDNSFSDHNVSCLDWSVQEIKSFGAMLHSFGISVVVATKNKSAYYDSCIISVTPNLDFMFSLIPKAILIMSEKIDWLLVGALISDAKLVMKETKRKIVQRVHKSEYDLINNCKFLGLNPDIYMEKEIKPIDIFNFIRDIK